MLLAFGSDNKLLLFAAALVDEETDEDDVVGRFRLLVCGLPDVEGEVELYKGSELKKINIKFTKIDVK